MKQNTTKARLNTIAVIGLDLAKNVFRIHAVDQQGKKVVNKNLRRKQVLDFFKQLPSCLVGMESCSSAHYWARSLSELGHQVRLIAPIHVKPYLKGNKNDANDAEAICEAVQRPNMRFVAIKTVEQQTILSLHKSRAFFVKKKVATINHIRGLLLEMGVAIPRGNGHLLEALPEYIEDAENGLPETFRALLAVLEEELKEILRRIARLEAKIQNDAKKQEKVRQLRAIPGIGLLGATALYATFAQAKNFHDSRSLAAFLGLVPKQYSSGGKTRLLGISKRGNPYLRSLLVHGARAVIYHIKRRIKQGEKGGYPWIEQLLKRRHVNQVAVALANKIARTAWVILNRGEDFQQARFCTLASKEV